MMNELDREAKERHSNLVFRGLRLLVAVHLDDEENIAIWNMRNSVVFHDRARLSVRADETKIFEEANFLQDSIRSASRELLEGFDTSLLDMVRTTVYIHRSIDGS